MMLQHQTAIGREVNPIPQTLVSMSKKIQENYANSCLKHAEKYIALGWSLIPLYPQSKFPLAELLPKKNGEPEWSPFKYRPATLPEVAHWLELYPNMNLGVITGEASGIVVVDYDRQPKTAPIMTAMVKTSRGYHCYCQLDGAVDAAKFPEGDIKAEGGYAVVPPSIHPSGDHYTWIEGLDPTEFKPIPYSEFVNHNQAIKQGIDGKGLQDKYISLATPPPTVSFLSANSLRDFVCDQSVALAIMGLCGVSVKGVGKAFRCPLPGHKERHPSSALYRCDDGTIMFHDFHQRDGAEWYCLAEVYAACKSGSVKKLGPGEKAVWLLRVLAELGIVNPPRLLAPHLPDCVPGSLRKVWDGFIKLLELRQLYDCEQVGAPYSYRFANTWTGVGPRQCQEANAWLLQHGYMKIVKPGRPAVLNIGTPRKV